MSELHTQMAYAIWRLQMWANGYGTYRDIDAAVERGELEPLREYAAKNTGGSDE